MNKTSYYKVISGKLNRDIQNPQLDSNEDLFNHGPMLEMRALAIAKVKKMMAQLLADGIDQFEVIPTKEQLASPEFKSEVVHFFEIRMISGDDEITIYSTLKNTLDAEIELFDGFLQEVLWYKTNENTPPIYEFKKPFNGFVLQADFDFIGSRLQTLKQKAD